MWWSLGLDEEEGRGRGQQGGLRWHRLGAQSLEALMTTVTSFVAILLRRWWLGALSLFIRIWFTTFPRMQCVMIPLSEAP